MHPALVWTLILVRQDVTKERKHPTMLKRVSTESLKTAFAGDSISLLP